MLTPLAALAVAALPFAALLALLALATRRERRRAEVVARQVALTDAIHRRLGAVAAPTVRRRPHGGWEIALAVPFERPALVQDVLAVALAATAGGQTPRVRLVLEPLGAR
ncbi:MAG: hypothetical protein A3I14_08070 [Candidatus Rokubacteria bacterium RIFCSPLOWO2_02_FULL_73_56]|nr:MAG: hypothetical protein A3I14_08070 [Candidatus Rokubacteria bacterium RIFCSPLOWO2_02_FULL_73_56]OGL25389.1 MAG: hypothetical protein A3G44_11860 [Candidatus Rokubacteria bacterium RIFCSPLOWO2_12_FULL_73_47]